MPQPSKPHKAAQRAVVGLRDFDAQDTEAAITREYAPLVEAAQDAAVCQHGRTDAGCRCYGCQLRAALKVTV